MNSTWWRLYVFTYTRLNSPNYNQNKPLHLDSWNTYLGILMLLINRTTYPYFVYLFSSSWLNQMTASMPLRGRSQTTLTNFWSFLTTYPPALTFSMVLTLTKSGHFETTYLPHLANVVYEWPLFLFQKSFFY